MNVTEYGPDGTTLVHTVVDNGDGTGVETHYDENGNVTEVVELTGLPIFTWPALDSAGALATLLVIEGVLPIEDAANAVRTVPENLVAEAEAWSVAANPLAP